MDSAAYLFPGMTEWLLILPIPATGYTSVIVLNPEKWPLKESWSTDMSPTTLFSLGDPWCSGVPGSAVGRGVPGVVRWGGSWEGAIPVPRPNHPRDPYLVIFSQRALPTALRTLYLRY